MGDLPVSERAACPSCGRYVGPYETCPYCGARLQGRASLRAIKLTALVLAAVGLAALWWAARQTEVPTLSVAEIQGLMNLAYVRVEGSVSRSVAFDSETGYLAFWLDDGTGELRVSSYRDVTQSLLDEGRVPAVGDVAAVAGTLRIREDFLSLTLNVPEHLVLSRPAPTPFKIGMLTSLDEGRRVRIEGEVEKISTPYEGLTLISARDDSGEIAIAVDDVLTALSGPLPPVIPGQALVVTGTVQLYRNAPQLVPASVGDILLYEAAVAEGPAAVTATATLTATAEPPMALGLLTEADAGRWAVVQGHVVAMEGIKGGLKATLDDGTGQLVVVFWQSVYEALPNPVMLDLGAELLLEGRLQLYEEVLELVPERAEEITLLTSAPELPWMEIQTLTGYDLGRVVRLRGVLQAPQDFSAGIKVPLDDGTGVIPVVLWSNVVAELDLPPEEGMLVEVAGEISVYREMLELLPRSRFDWRPQ